MQSRLRSGHLLVKSTDDMQPDAARPEHTALYIPMDHPGETEAKPVMPATWASWLLQYRVAAVDVAVLVALVILYIGMEVATPHNNFIVKDTLWKQSYPYKDNTVPSWTVPVYSLGAPLLAFTAARFLLPANKLFTWTVWYRTCYALVFAVFLTAAITDCLKNGVGRLRPNFVSRCWPNGTAIAFTQETQFGGYAVCECSSATEAEHRKSFPSGHSSWSASGLGFLTFWLLGQTHAFSGAGRGWPVMLSVVPMLGAVAVGVTRITDYWHHVSDVVFGLALGYGISLAVYLSLYPFFTHPHCHAPLFAMRKPASLPAQPAQVHHDSLQMKPLHSHPAGWTGPAGASGSS